MHIDMKTCALAAATLLPGISACGGHKAQAEEAARAEGGAATDTTLAGEWVREGLHGPVGLRLGGDGRAESVNQPRLPYETWTRRGDTLIVSGKSLGEGYEEAVADTLTLDGDTLTLHIGGQPAVKYVRRH